VNVDFHAAGSVRTLDEDGQQWQEDVCLREHSMQCRRLKSSQDACGLGIQTGKSKDVFKNLMIDHVIVS
jgi:hypothetical protein